MATPKYDPKKYHAYYPGTLTRAIHFLQANGIESRQDFFDKYDDDATAKDFDNTMDGVGPRIAELLVWLRGKSIEDWRRLTGLPAFNDPAIEDGSKGAMVLDTTTASE